MAEVVALTRDLGGVAARKGPLADSKGIIWLSVPAKNVEQAQGRLRRLGYSRAAEVVEPTGPDTERLAKTRWRRREVALRPVYAESDDYLRSQAPDARSFVLECGDGVVRTVDGYRGGRGPMEHRALPVPDARLLVNLVFMPNAGVLMDPFAGAGGVVIEARAAGGTVVSLDLDPALRYGLAAYGARHSVADAVALPMRTGSVDAIATEPPYHSTARQLVMRSITEMARVLRPGARAALLVAGSQGEELTETARAIGLQCEMLARIDRKGTDVACVVLVR